MSRNLREELNPHIYGRAYVNAHGTNVHIHKHFCLCTQCKCTYTETIMYMHIYKLVVHAYLKEFHICVQVPWYVHAYTKALYACVYGCLYGSLEICRIDIICHINGALWQFSSSSMLALLISSHLAFTLGFIHCKICFLTQYLGKQSLRKVSSVITPWKWCPQQP